MTERRFGRVTDPPASFVLVGARVIDPAAGRDEARDLAVVDGRIADDAPVHVERIEAGGLVVAPGFCDLHTHLREPGTDGETLETGMRAAARGGFTTVCAMPNTDPALDDPALVRDVLARASGGPCRVRVIGAATRGRAGRELADLEGLGATGVVAVSDDGVGVPDASAQELFARLASLEMLLIEHAEDAERSRAGVMRSGPVATRLGLPGWPPDAEGGMVERDLRLAAVTGARVHLTHLSTVAAVEAVARAKDQGVRATCDVTPHHLALTDAWVAGSRSFAWEAAGDFDALTAFDGRVRVNPPLSSTQDALGLLAAVEDGTVDAIATDHAPHPAHRKQVAFAEAAPGLIGLETALSLGLAAVEAGRLSLGRLLAALSTSPAAIIGEDRSLSRGALADLVVFDPVARWRVDAGDLASASANTPLIGRELPGLVRMTVADGRITYRS